MIKLRLRGPKRVHANEGRRGAASERHRAVQKVEVCSNTWAQLPAVICQPVLNVAPDSPKPGEASGGSGCEYSCFWSCWGMGHSVCMINLLILPHADPSGP